MNKKELEEELKLAKRQIEIKDEYLTMIIGITAGYDGLGGSIEGLKFLVDELVDFARLARANDDKTRIYNGKIKGSDGKIRDLGKALNILHEEIEEEYYE